MIDETSPGTGTHKYFGKYRGTVVNNLDPENRGRIQAIVPDVQGLVPMTYALPCLPAAGKGSGTFVVPELGSSVWIEFEQGNPDYPIWSGCFWATTLELPEMGIVSKSPAHNMVFQTTGRNSITVFGMPADGITLCSGPIAIPTSPRIMITATSIVLTNGIADITITGTSVIINKGVLVVT
jgi:hypothetical protein